VAAAVNHAWLGAGISLRRAHLTEAIVYSGALDVVEIVADHFFDPAPDNNPALSALRERFTLLPHGLDLSLGSAEGLSQPYLVRLGSLVDAVQPPFWSEHVAFTQAGGRRIGHLAPIPFTYEALDVLANNVARAALRIERPLILENIACPFDVPHAELGEGAFLTELVERTGCGLLLDVANLYYNALNRHKDPLEMLAEFPLHAVVQCHLAGGHRDSGEWIDSHAHPVPEPVWSLFEEVSRRAPLRATIVERDENLPAFGELAAEAERARHIMLRYAA
jgi:uncharacterized protein